MFEAEWTAADGCILPAPPDGSLSLLVECVRAKQRRTDRMMAWTLVDNWAWGLGSCVSENGQKSFYSLNLLPLLSRCVGSLALRSKEVKLNSTI